MKYSVKKMISMVTMAAVAISSFAFLKADAAVQTLSYVKYTYATNETSDYDLSLSDATTAMQQRAVIDEDERKIGGINGVVRLVDSNFWRGTGFIVDDHVIATAAHCVYDIDNHAWDSTDNFAPGLKIQMYNADGTPKNLYYNVDEVHILKSGYLNGTNGTIDYALLYVSEDLSEYPQFDLGITYNVNTSAFQNIDLFITGIPQYKPDENLNSQFYVYSGKGNATASTESMLHYTCDSSSGQSGSPVYTAVTYTVDNETYTTYTAVGVHSGSYSGSANRCARMTAPRIQFYLSNPNIGS